MYFYLVIAVCMAAAVFTVWKEHHAGKQRLAWRITASLLAVVALAGIALPLSYQGETGPALSEAVLLTQGFSADSLSKFKNDSLLTFDPSVKKEYHKATLITPGQVKGIQPRVTGLQVFGYGLSKDDLGRLDSLPLVFHPTANPLGIAAIGWNDRIIQGQLLKVQGSFNNSSDRPVQLVLKGLNTSVDSIIIAGKSTAAFELSDFPKGSGPSAYQLIIIDGKDTLSNEALPFIIGPVRPLKVLMLAASPAFDSKFLKNWLAENGFAVAFRSAISKDKFNAEFINMPKAPLNALTAALLGKFDVLVSDLSVLHLLNSAESFALKQQVTTKGLGLIVKADTSFKTSLWEQAGFQLLKPLTKDITPSLLTIDGKKTRSNISAEQIFVGGQPGTVPLVNDVHNRALATINIAGEGKIAVTTLTDTYTWMLGGDKNDYASLWSMLIGKTAHEVMPPDTWQTLSSIPAVDGPVQLQVETGARVGPINMDGMLLSPAQNPGLPFQWQSTWWPTAAGWHTAALFGGVPAPVYIYNDKNWTSIKKFQKIELTKKYAETMKYGDVTTLIHQKVKKQVPKVYFYILLIGACTFLWTEEKYRSGEV